MRFLNAFETGSDVLAGIPCARLADDRGDAAREARQISRKTKLVEAIRCALSRWEALTRFVNSGRIEIDSNVVERAIRPIALNRKNSLFAGSDGGGEHWAIIASLIETCKLGGIDPLSYPRQRHHQDHQRPS